MVASVIVIIQLVRRSGGAVNLQNLLDFVGGVKEMPQARNDIAAAGKCLLMLCEAKKAS